MPRPHINRMLYHGVCARCGLVDVHGCQVLLPSPRSPPATVPTPVPPAGSAPMVSPLATARDTNTPGSIIKPPAPGFAPVTSRRLAPRRPAWGGSPLKLDWGTAPESNAEGATERAFSGWTALRESRPRLPRDRGLARSVRCGAVRTPRSAISRTKVSRAISGPTCTETSGTPQPRHHSAPRSVAANRSPDAPRAAEEPIRPARISLPQQNHRPSRRHLFTSLPPDFAASPHRSILNSTVVASGLDGCTTE